MTYRKRGLLTAAACAALLCASLATTANAGQHFVQLKQATELATDPAAYRPDINLYVRGQVPLREDQLEDFGQWLQENRPGWVWVLIDTAVGERFQATDGLMQDTDAVTWSLGLTVMNSPAFQKAKDSRTGLPNRSIGYFDFARAGAFVWTSPYHEYYGVNEEAYWIKIATENLKPAVNDSQYVRAFQDTSNAFDGVLAAKVSRAFWLPVGTATAVALAILGGVIVALIVLRKRTSAARTKVETLLKQWDESFHDRYASIAQLDERRSKAFINKQTGLNYEGRTAEVAKAVIGGVDNLFIFHGCASIALEKARAKMTNAGSFSAAPYEEALKVLQTDQIEFDPKDINIRTAVFGQDAASTDKLWADIEAYQPFSITFDELIARFKKTAEETEKSLSEAESAIQNASNNAAQAEKEFEAVRGAFKDLEGALSAEAVLAFPDFWATFTPAIEEQLNALLPLTQTDPVQAVEQVQNLSTRLQTASQIMRELKETVGDESTKALEAEARLQKLGFNPAWIRSELAEISTRANALLIELATPEEDTLHCSVESDFNSVMARCQKAEALAKALLEEQRPALKAAESTVADKAKAFAAKLSIDVSKIFQEANNRPADYLQTATQCSGLVASLIDSGKLDQAASTAAELAENVRTANQIVSNSEQALNGYGSRRQTIEKRADELDDAVEPSGKILVGIRNQFAPAVLAFRSGDHNHPDADGTVDNNLEEVEAQQHERANALERSLKAYNHGQLLQSSDLLGEAEACNRRIDYRLTEIRVKREKLDKAIAANAETLTRLDERSKGLQGRMNEREIQQDTISSYEASAAKLVAAASGLKRRKSDPFAMTAELEAVSQAFNAVDNLIARDGREYADAVRSIATTEERVRTLTQAVTAASNDDIADSSEIDRVRERSNALRLEIARLKGKIDAQKHGKWSELSAQADAFSKTLTELTSQLAREVQAGHAAAKALQEADLAVRQANAWVDRDYGVVISNDRGTAELRSGNAALLHGNYGDAASYAASAKSKAHKAVEAGEAERRRIRRQREEAAEAALAAARAAAAVISAAQHSSSPSHHHSSGGHTSRPSSPSHNSPSPSPRPGHGGSKEFRC